LKKITFEEFVTSEQLEIYSQLEIFEF